MSTSSIGNILPRDKGAAPLDIVIAVMAFLASLALGASLIAERTALGWRAGLSDRLTVQVVPADVDDPLPALDSETRAAVAVLRATPGVAHAAPLSETETQKLVEPWLGAGSMVAELPMPRLVDATIAPGATLDLPSLSARLKTAAPHSTLDDHSRWLGRLRGLADAVIWSAYGILVLIAVATAATVAFATRAGLEAHHEVVELLHQMGAHAWFISRAFEKHYFWAALIASALGASIGALIFLGAAALELVGVEAVPFLPPLALRPIEVPWLAAVPVVAGIIAWATARLSVLSAVNEIY